jgi:hypothetical protein
MGPFRCSENDGENGLSIDVGDNVIACVLISNDDGGQSLTAKRHAPGASSVHAKLPTDATLEATTRLDAAQTTADKSDADWDTDSGADRKGAATMAAWRVSIALLSAAAEDSPAPKYETRAHRPSASAAEVAILES